MSPYLTDIIDDAYKLYMPQVRSEITALAEYIRQYDVRGGMTTVEIGTKYGGTFWIWCSMFNASDDLNISIDMSDGGKHGGITEVEMDNRDKLFNETFTNCKFIRGDSHFHETFTTLCKLSHATRLPPSGIINSKMLLYKPFIDFLFIDGDHSYEGVKEDFEKYSPYVKTGGSIVFHDINDSQRHRDRGVMVSQFWQELKDSGQYDTVEFNAGQDWAGVGIAIKN